MRQEIFGQPAIPHSFIVRDFSSLILVVNRGGDKAGFRCWALPFLRPISSTSGCKVDARRDTWTETAPFPERGSSRTR